MAMAMQPQSYDKKAWLYAKHRWDYPKPAIDQVLATTGIGEDSVVADIGSGTGSLARHFLPVAKRVYGVEPVFEMRKIADDQLAPNPNFKGVRGSAEETTLPDASVDLITVGQALHWFDPSRAVPEFRRILKQDGWVAVLRYSIVEEEVAKAIEELHRDYPPPTAPINAPVEAFLDAGTMKSFSYTMPRREDLERFVGAQLSSSGAPVERDERFHDFRDRAHSIFDRFAKDDLLILTQKTELFIGRPVAG